MSEHYYSHNPETESNPQNLSSILRNHPFQFITDSGVFSKQRVDFGSKLLIESFVEPVVDGPILDVGCGYGPIGLSLAKSFPKRLVHMIDVNERALELAKENARINQISNVEIYKSDIFASVKETSFAAIVTNPPIRAGKQVVFSILEESYKHLQENGELWVVIQKKQGAPSAKKKLAELFNGKVEVVKKDKGYYILLAKKDLT